jgi:predicted O-linked N-acetylglucosamine transferase (SPINDLY family)
MMWGLDFPVIPTNRAQIEEARSRYQAQLHKLKTLLDADTNNPEWILAFSRSCFFLNYHGGDDFILLQQHQALQTQYLQANTHTQKIITKTNNKKIRLGVFSANLHGHTVFRYFSRWLLELDRQQFEVVILHAGKWQDAHTDTLIHSGVDYHYIFHQANLNDYIAQLGLDILLTLDVGMAGRNMPLLSYRMAPVQCVTWGHPVTTAASEVDYYLSSEAQEPEDAQAHYRETLIRLPGLGICFTPIEAPAPAEVSKYGLDPQRPVCLIAQSLFKLMPECDALFAEICRRVPTVQLVLFAKADDVDRQLLHARMRKAFDAIGVPIDAHVHYLPTVSHAEFCALFKASTLSLDSLFFSGGNTSLDGLANDCPIVTLPGRYMRGRQTYGMYQVMGFTELIAKDEADYVGLACRLLQEADFRQHCVDEIAQRKNKLFHNVQAVRHFEQALIDMHSGNSSNKKLNAKSPRG